MHTIKKLVQDVSTARSEYILQMEPFTEAQAQWKPLPEVWNMIENTEHLFWAEQGGILGMWKTLHAIREGKTARTYESDHQDMAIEQIIELTWQVKEKVPAVAAPRFGGPLAFWSTSLNSLQRILDAFGNDLQEEELRIQAHPHPISGAMDFQQRLEFLCFHINRHKEQVSSLIKDLKINQS